MQFTSVAESPVSIECALHATVRDGRPRIEHRRPLARLGEHVRG